MVMKVIVFMTGIPFSVLLNLVLFLLLIPGGKYSILSPDVLDGPRRRVFENFASVPAAWRRRPSSASWLTMNPTEPRKCLLHEPVGMQADAEHVHAEPREARDDVAKDRHDHETALPNEPAPARVQNNRAPKNNQHGAVFLRVPTPETSPGLVGPNSAKHRADKAEEGGETNDAIGHARERIGRFFLSDRVNTPRTT